MKSCSVIVPVYRGGRYLPALAERLARVLPRHFESYEAIFVNDGSPDDSWDVIENLARQYEFARGIRLMRNYGQHNATLCGIREARYELIVTMDQDLQHQPEDLPLLLEKINEGFDVVYGAPKKLPQGFFRNLLTRAVKTILSNIMGVPSVRNISAFRMFRASLKCAFDNFQSPTLIIDVPLSWGTTRFASVQADVARAEKSNYNFWSLAKAAMLILTGYSVLPLRLASFLGFFMTLFGLGVFVYVLVVYFTAGSLPGFPFLASAISIFSGAQMFTLGVFGEYLARVFDRSMGKPPYLVQETTEKRRA